MAPRTQHGASANARQASRRGGAAASPRSRTKSRTGTTGPARARSGAASDASSRAGTRPGAGATRKPDDRTSLQRGVFRWLLVPGVVLGVLVLFVLAYYPVARVQYRELRTKAKLTSELSAIQTRNRRLAQQVAQLSTPGGVQQQATNQLGLVKAGESVAIVVDGSKPVTPVAGIPARIDTGNIRPTPAGPWTAFLDSFFGVNTQ